MILFLDTRYYSALSRNTDRIDLRLAGCTLVWRVSPAKSTASIPAVFPRIVHAAERGIGVVRERDARSADVAGRSHGHIRASLQHFIGRLAMAHSMTNLPAAAYSVWRVRLQFPAIVVALTWGATMNSSSTNAKHRAYPAYHIS